MRCESGAAGAEWTHSFAVDAADDAKVRPVREGLADARARGRVAALERLARDALSEPVRVTVGEVGEAAQWGYSDVDEDDEDAAGGWDMWQSPSILDYSLAALRGPP